jgi:hypothetical protein
MSFKIIMLPESPETILRFRRGRPQAKPVDKPLSAGWRGTGGNQEPPVGRIEATLGSFSPAGDSQDNETPGFLSPIAFPRLRKLPRVPAFLNPIPLPIRAFPAS